MSLSLKSCRWIAILQLFLAQIIRAEVPTLILEDLPTLEISNTIDLYLDSDNQDTIQSVSSPGFQGFKRNSELFPSFGVFSGTAWLRFALHNPSDREVQSILLLNAPVLDTHLYFKDESDTWVKYVAGRLHINDQETFPNMMPRFNLILKPGKTVHYYMSIRSYIVYSIKLTINKPEVFYQNQRLAHFFAGLYVGIMLIMSFYNLFIYASTRDSAYLWYVITVLTLHLGVFSYFITNGDYLGIKSAILPSMDIWIFKCLGFASLIQFSRKFLYTKEVPGYDLYLKGNFAVSGLFILLTPFFPVAKLNAFHNILVVITVMTFIVYSGRLFSLGKSYARYYFIAWFPFMIMALILITLNMTKKSHLMPNMNFVLCVSACVEVLLLSMALGDKFNEMRKAKEKAEQEHKEAVLAMNRSLEALVKEKTRDIRSMLDNLQLGIFTVDHNMLVSEEHSRHLKTMVSPQNIQTRLLSNVLFEDANVGHDIKDQVEAAVLASTDTDDLGFMGNAHLLIRQFQKTINHESREMEVDWSPIQNEEGIVEKLLVCMKDVTEFNQLKKAGEAQTRRIEMLRQYLKSEMTQVRKLEERLLASAAKGRTVSEGRLATWSDAEQAEFVGQIFADLHTAKALSRKLSLTYLSDAIHAGENHLHEIMEGRVALHMDAIHGLFLQIIDRIAEYQSVVSELGLQSQTSSVITQPRSFEGLVIDALAERRTLATRLQKRPPLIQLDFGEEIACDGQLEQTLETLLVHLVRNSMDHGIESPELRLARSKPEQGLISISLKKMGPLCVLEYQDDGQGLNLDLIHARAVDKGLLQGEQTLSNDEIAALIFTPGFSTKEKVSDISGRGVGLDAVTRQVASLGGKIEVHLIERLESGRYGRWSALFRLSWPPTLPTLQKAAS